MKKKFIARIREGGSVEASYFGYKFYAWSYWYVSFSFGRRDYRIGTFGDKHFQYLKREYCHCWGGSGRVVTDFCKIHRKS